MKITKVESCLKKRDGVYGIWTTHGSKMPHLSDVVNMLETDCASVVIHFDNGVQLQFRLKDDKLVVYPIREFKGKGGLSRYSHKFTKSEKENLHSILNSNFGAFDDFYECRGKFVHFEQRER